MRIPLGLVIMLLAIVLLVSACNTMTDIEKGQTAAAEEKAHLEQTRIAFYEAQGMAKMIDEYIIRNFPNSPLVGYGSTFVAYGRQYNVDPRFVIAIAGAETSFGTRLCADYNAWNYFFEGTGCAGSDYSSWEEAIPSVTEFIHRYISDDPPVKGGRGYDTLSEFVYVGDTGSGGTCPSLCYCVSQCQHWLTNVTRFYTELGGEPNHLTFEGMPPFLGAITTQLGVSADIPSISVNVAGTQIFTLTRIKGGIERIDGCNGLCDNVLFGEYQIKNVTNQLGFDLGSDECTVTWIHSVSHIEPGEVQTIYCTEQYRDVNYWKTFKPCIEISNWRTKFPRTKVCLDPFSTTSVPLSHLVDVKVWVAAKDSWCLTPTTYANVSAKEGIPREVGVRVSFEGASDYFLEANFDSVWTIKYSLILKTASTVMFKYCGEPKGRVCTDLSAPGLSESRVCQTASSP